MATKEQKLELIRENLAEVLNPEIIDEVLDKGETLRIYWGGLLQSRILQMLYTGLALNVLLTRIIGSATTGKPHCGYFVPVRGISTW